MRSELIRAAQLIAPRECSKNEFDHRMYNYQYVQRQSSYSSTSSSASCSPFRVDTERNASQPSQFRPSQPLSLDDTLRTNLLTHSEKDLFSEAVQIFDLGQLTMIQAAHCSNSVNFWLDCAIRSITISARRLSKFKLLSSSEQIALLKDTVVEVMFIKSLFYFNEARNAIVWNSVTVSALRSDCAT